MAELEIVHADAVNTSGQDLRTGLLGLQEGVWDAGDLKCVPGAGLSIDVPAGLVLVQGDHIPRQGLYHCVNDATKNTAAFELGGIPAAHATLPRLDQIIARAYDHAADASGLRKWRLEVLAGTATAGATLDNRNGAAVLPSSACRLLDFLTPAAFAGPYVAATHFRDRRPWARGAFRRIAQVSGTDYTTASTSWVELDSANTACRIECSGAPLLIKFFAERVQHSGAAGTIELAPRAGTLGGSQIFGTEGALHNTAAATYATWCDLEWIDVPGPGSQLFSIYWKTSGATATIQRGTDYAVFFAVQELIRQNASN